MPQVVGLMILVHTLFQMFLGYVLGQPYQAACAVVALPVVLALAGIAGYVLGEVWEVLFPYKWEG